MLEKLKKLLGIVSKYEVATQRDCLAGFLVALAKADEDENGNINVKEFLKLCGNTIVSATVNPGMPDSEIIARTESFLKRV